ncbi:MAG: hypothetical protein IPP72_13520 [Chitinophagaceae bacterium]|nr:hypothetical protein [Chitinophagaceae bacterium]
MLLVKLTTAKMMMRFTGLVLTFFIIYTTAAAQENSPYSRYGLGDLVPSQNIVTRAMGGIAAGFSDDQSVNFVNPASYGNLSYIDPVLLKQSSGILKRTIFDFGFEIDSRSLKQIDPSAKYSATNLIVSYMQLGLPIRLKKANKKGIFLGVNFGLRPVSRINYKILNIERKPGIDSIGTVYEGSGGLNEALIGAGLRIKNFNIGFNTGYRFGNKDYSTKLTFLNDTVSHYQSNSSSKTNFGAVFFTLGTQYEQKFTRKDGDQVKNAYLRFGAYASLSQTMNGTNETLRETVQYDDAGGIYRIDSVFRSTQDGKVQYPSSWGAGFSYQDFNAHWKFGADYEQSSWSGYKFFGQADKVQNTWKVRGGAEYFPATWGRTPFKKYFSYVKYRAGFYYGPNYINLGTNMPEVGFSIGAGFPLKLRTGFYETQASYLNTLIEFGSRGNKNSNLRESFVRIGIGLSLSDLWFNRSKYY